MCAIPSIRTVRYSFPDAGIFLIGLPWSRNFTERFNHYFDGFVEFPGYPGLPERKTETKKVVNFLKQVQREKFDLALQMQGDGSIVNPLVDLFGAKVVAGYRLKGTYKDRDDMFLEYPAKLHEIKRHLALMEYLGLESRGVDLEFPVENCEQEGADRLLGSFGVENRKFVVIHGGARDERRRWKVEYFARMADYIKDNGYAVVITGSKEEREVTQNIKRLATIEVVDLGGKTNLGIFAGVLKRARLVISNDTGTSHLVAALKIPSVIIFSPYSELKRWAPLNKKIHKTVSASKSNNFEYVLEQVAKSLKKKLPREVESYQKA